MTPVLDPAATLTLRLQTINIRFRQPGTGWTVADAHCLDGPPALVQRPLVLTGIVPTGTFTAEVQAETNPRFGVQYRLLRRLDAPAPPAAAPLPTAPTDPAGVPLTVSVEEIRHLKEDTGWLVAYVQVLAGPPRLVRTLILLTGVLPSLYPGCCLDVVAVEDDNPRWGRQWKVLSAVPRLPFDEAGMRRYLEGAFKTVGPKRSAAIWAAWGMDSPAVLDSPAAVVRLATEAGIPAGFGTGIVEQWQRQSAERAALLTLASAGLSMSQCLRVARHFGKETGPILALDPYRLLEVDGISFRVADSVALRTNLAPGDPRRLEAALAETARQAAQRGGHCWTAVGEATDGASALIGQDVTLFSPVVAALRAEAGMLVAVQGDQVWPSGLLQDEGSLARQLQQLQVAPIPPVYLNEAAWAAVFSAQRNADESRITLSAEQQAAVRFLVDQPVAALISGPGTGKTTCLRAVLNALRAGGLSNVRLVAPTGKAAKRMKETTGQKATTIHSLLGEGVESGRTGWAKSAESTAERTVLVASNVVVVDEASMLDLRLAARLVTALPLGARLLLIGDTDQLPSVGPGRVLADLLDAGLPVAQLTQVFRQAAESAIIQAAYTIIGGACPALPAVTGRLADAPGDAVLVEAPTDREIVRQAVTLVSELIPAAYGIAPADIRVLCPTYKGEAGIHRLNAALQAALNPPAPGKAEWAWSDAPVDEHSKQKRILRVGDRLLWLENNPQLGLVNGSEVEVVALTADPKTVTVRSLDDEAAAPIPPLRLAELEAMHSYAMTVHKSQGSEYPCAVVIAHAAHSFAGRRLMYTAITRAKRRLIVLGTLGALAKAVARNHEDGRRTELPARLRAHRAALVAAA